MRRAARRLCGARSRAALEAESSCVLGHEHQVHQKQILKGWAAEQSRAEQLQPGRRRQPLLALLRSGLRVHTYIFGVLDPKHVGQHPYPQEGKGLCSLPKTHPRHPRQRQPFGQTRTLGQGQGTLPLPVFESPPKLQAPLQLQPGIPQILTAVDRGGTAEAGKEAQRHRGHVLHRPGREAEHCWQEAGTTSPSPFITACKKNAKSARADRSAERSRSLVPGSPGRAPGLLEASAAPPARFPAPSASRKRPPRT